MTSSNSNVVFFVQQARISTPLKDAVVVCPLEFGAGRCYLPCMFDWIRQRRTWIATLLLVVLLPVTAVMGQSLVWCFGADGHSGIEAPHRPHAAHVFHNVTAVDAELCADIIWGAPATVLRSTSDQIPTPAHWFGGDTPPILVECETSENVTPFALGTRDRVPRPLEHLRTVILRV